MTQVGEIQLFLLNQLPEVTWLKLGKLQLWLDPTHHHLLHFLFARASGCQDSQIRGLRNTLHLP